MRRGRRRARVPGFRRRRTCFLDLADLLGEVGNRSTREDESHRVEFGRLEAVKEQVATWGSAPFGHLLESRGHATLRDVVNERKLRSCAPNEPDQLGLERQVDPSQ